MRKLVYVVNGVEIASYERARALQPTGALQTRLEEIREEVEVDPKTREKRNKYFEKLRACNKAKTLKREVSRVGELG